MFYARSTLAGDILELFTAIVAFEPGQALRWEAVQTVRGLTEGRRRSGVADLQQAGLSALRPPQGPWRASASSPVRQFSEQSRLQDKVQSVLTRTSFRDSALRGAELQVSQPEAQTTAL